MCLDWEEAYSNLKAALGFPADSPTPKIPRPNNEPTTSTINSIPSAPGKRKADQDSDVKMSDATEKAPSKRSKKKVPPPAKDVKTPESDESSDPQVAHARAAAAFIPFLAPENLLAPKMPTREEMEGVLLTLRKQALVEEYFGNGEEQKA